MAEVGFALRATKRILCVESNEDCRQMLVALLKYLDYDVTATMSVTDGMSQARLEQFDLLILGSRFTDSTGVDLCRQIRAFDPETPIMFYSTASYDSDIKAGIDAGAQRYLTKPTGIDIIEQAIIELLGGSMNARAQVSEW